MWVCVCVCVCVFVAPGGSPQAHSPIRPVLNQLCTLSLRGLQPTEGERERERETERERQKEREREREKERGGGSRQNWGIMGIMTHTHIDFNLCFFLRTLSERASQSVSPALIVW